MLYKINIKYYTLNIRYNYNRGPYGISLMSYLRPACCWLRRGLMSFTYGLWEWWWGGSKGER